MKSLTSPEKVGLILCVLGFLISIPSYFLWPLGVAKPCTEFWCASPTSTFNTPTLGDFLIHSFSPPAAPLVTAVALLSMLISTSMPILAFSYGRTERSIFYKLIYAGIFVGLSPMLVFAFLVFQFWYPSTGFYGILFSYTLFFGAYLAFKLSEI